MEAFDALMGGFAIALQPTTLMWGFVGCFVGTLVGVLPGIGPALTIALLLPLTYHVPATSMFVMFAGIYYGAAYGGSTTSILLNTPGESAAVVTALEGNKMARRGRAGQALATAAIGSFVAHHRHIGLDLCGALGGGGGIGLWPGRVFQPHGVVGGGRVGGAGQFDVAGLGGPGLGLIAGHGGH